MKLDSATLKARFAVYAGKFRRYAVPIYLLFLLAIYGFLAWKVIAFDQTEPDPSVVSSRIETSGVPRVDKDVVSKIQQLQDNSVDVRALFDQARRNPFQE